MTNVSTIETALSALVRNDGKTGVAAFDYMALALVPLNAAEQGKAEEAAQSLIVAICDATGARGKPTKEFPKGKANPNAIKQAGFAMTAECARLVRKVGKALDDGNDAVSKIVAGTLGVIPSETLISEAFDGSKALAKAIASGDEARVDRCKAAIIADVLNAYYGEARCNTFGGLRRQLDKATASKAETVSDSDSDNGNVSDEAIAVVAADVLAHASADALADALIGKLGEASDDALALLLEAIRDEAGRRAGADDMAAAA